MALLFSSPKGPAGALVELDSPTGNVLSPVVELFGVPDPAFGAQTAVAINPGTGNDAGPGTVAQPLRTMGEFNRRYAGLLVTAPATLQLVGDVLDAPLWLSGTRFASGSSFTVSGTRTDLGSTTISTVTGLGNTAADPPWDITTAAGFDWTTIPVGSQLRLPATSQIGWIMEVLASNRVIVSVMGQPGGSIAIPAPTVGATLTAASLSRALPCLINAYGLSPRQTIQAIIQNISFDSPGPLWGLSGNLQTQFYGCEMKFATAGDFIVTLPLNLRCNRWTIAASVASRVAGDTLNSIGHCVVGTTGAQSHNHQSGNSSHAFECLHRARFGASGSQTFVIASIVNIRNSIGPVFCQSGAVIECSGGAPGITGSVGNTGVGIDVPLGRVQYSSTTKPSVTGASDCRVGGVAKTYANIPYINFDATVPGNLTGNGASIVQQ